jgi:sugar phosphate isomerase/epimerase
MTISRRRFLESNLAVAGTLLTGAITQRAGAASPAPGMQLGLVTYNWGKDWDLPTVIRNCAETGFSGVELRSTHKHGVEISLQPAERQEVRRRFEDSPVKLVGLGSACEYHSPDPEVVAKNIQETKEFIRLCHDCGGTGVKVRPNGLPSDVPVPRTLEQIGRALNEVAKFGADFGVAIRLEVHGRGTSELPHIKTIMNAADHPNAVVCWNCNPTDLEGEGLEHNFRLVQDRLGTIHIHDLTKDNYPWEQLFALLKQSGFQGWTLLEDGSVPQDIPAAMRANRRRWKALAGA